MSASKCRVCAGPLRVLPIGKAGARAVALRLTVQAEAGRRFGEFSLCPRCSGFAASPELAASVQAALFAELQALLR